MSPVGATLNNAPEDWPWSSFRHYATGVEGIVEIESHWAASRRERAGVRLTVRELLTVSSCYSRNLGHLRTGYLSP